MSGDDKVVILADWGNSSGRLFCVRGMRISPEILGQIRISGAKDTEDCAAVFEAATKHWRNEYDIKEAWLCGAVTSNIGWLTTDYARVPARVRDIGITTLESGLSCHFLQGTSVTQNTDGYYDTVRGEDMQAHGWVELTGLKNGLLCLPGTHTKWIGMRDGAIAGISTGVTGETFEVLDRHSILTRGAGDDGSETAFLHGLEVMRRTPRPPLTHMLMSVRNLQLAGNLTAGEARDYLSGLLIGEDCAARESDKPIHIIGDGPSSDRYDLALRHYRQETIRHDGQACVIAGLQAVRRNN